jgi:thioredoxin-like negative regulator of GroEL
MKYVLLLPAFALLGSCDHIDAVGDKVNELKDMRKESTAGVEGMDLKALMEGAKDTGPAVQDIGEVDFQEFVTGPGKLNVVVFHADWCGPCKRFAPVISGVVEAHSGVVRMGRVNVDQARELCTELGVRSIPDVRFFIDGEMIHKFTGGLSRDGIESLIATHSANIDPTAGTAGGVDQGFPGAAENDGTTATVPANPRPANAKPIGEAVKPMDKDWLPPGMSRK